MVTEVTSKRIEKRCAFFSNGYFVEANKCSAFSALSALSAILPQVPKCISTLQLSKCINALLFQVRKYPSS